MTDRDDPSPSDPLLVALGRAAREEAQQTEAWWAAASKQDGTPLPPDGPDLEALAPLSGEEQGKMTEALFGIPAEEPAPVVSLASRRRVLSVAAGLALAAGVAAMVLFSGPQALPGYRLEVQAGEKVLRSEQGVADEPEYVEGSVLSFVLRPEAQAEVPVTVAAVLEPDGGAARVVPFDVTLASGGAVRLVAELGETFSAPPGRYRLVFLVGPEGALPSDPAISGTQPLEGVQRLEHRFRIVSPN